MTDLVLDPFDTSATEGRAETAPTHGRTVDSQWRHHRRFTWVDGSGRAVSVRVDTPPTERVRGAVVLVPSFAREAVVSYRTVRAMAVHAARAGFLACTFSLSGDGDSQDLAPGEDTVAAWLADVRAVRDFAARLVGAPQAARPVHVVGLRLGGALVQHLHREDIANDDASGVRGAYVAWEPVSGRAFLRHHVNLRSTGVPGEAVDDGVELDGFLLRDEVSASVRGLEAARRADATPLPPTGLTEGELHVRFEADRRASARLALGATYFAHVPADSIGELLAALPAGPEGRAPAWTPAASATFPTTDEDGHVHLVTETHVAIGPRQVPGILTRHEGITPRAGLALSAMGAEVKWGPGRVWTRAARDLAPRGVVSLRADRSGIGDDVDPGIVHEPEPYTDEAVGDTAAAIDHLRGLLPSGALIAGAGVCAGSWSLLRAACVTDIDAVVAVNPVHWNPDTSLYTRAFYDHYHGTEAPALDNPAGEDSLTVTASLRDPRRVLARVKKTCSRELALRMPRLRSRLRPEVPIDQVRYLLDHVRGGTCLILVLGHEEQRIFAGKGGRRAAARARRHGVEVEVTQPADLDHSLLSERARRETLRLLRRVCVPTGAT